MKSPATVTELAQSAGSQPAAEAEAAVARSSFYAAIRVLPPEQRNAMFELYRFCRAVDDIADGRGAREERMAALESWRSDVDALFGGTPSARTWPLLEPIRAFELRREDFLSIIDGVEMDANADIRAPELPTLELYCDRVACAVGRLSVRVFGLPEPEGSALSFHLGRALQLTNILRDLDEDAKKRRLYLPREMLLAAGIVETEPSIVLSHPAVGVACASLVHHARGHFFAAHSIIARLPVQSARTPRLMARVYENILQRLVVRGWKPPRRPIVISRIRLMWILLLDGLAGSPRRERA